METVVGGIINKFKIKTRRTTLFFEDILAQYIKECENAGHGHKIREIGEKWGALGAKKLGKLKMFQSIRLLDNVMRIVWHNIGIMDDFSVKKIGNNVIIETKDEFITRIIGVNQFMIGFFAGCTLSFLGKKVKIKKVEKDGGRMKYIFDVTEEAMNIESKEKDLYNKLNIVSSKEGLMLKSALGLRLFTLKGNRIYFRGKSIIPIENTVFHLIGAENLLIENVSTISYNFFRGVVKHASPPEKKLILLKTLLQTMGWCTVFIRYKKNEVIMKVNNLPVGLQKKNDNWIFLTNVIAGYLRLVNNNFLIKQSVKKGRRLDIVFEKK